jgi:ELWxxDGT repeat protein
VVGDTLYFFDALPDLGLKLWKSDGTTAGTVLVKNIRPTSNSAYASDVRAVGRYLYFIVSETGRGHEVWRSDGTSGGTARVESIGRVPEDQRLRLLGAIGRDLYFTRTHPADRLMQLRRLRPGCSGGGCNERIATLPNPYADREYAEPFITTFAVSGERLYFGMGISSSGPGPLDVQLWVTDGTRSGTTLLHRPLSLSDEFGSQIFAVDSRVLFTGGDASGGNLEPWVSDGTVRGTWRLHDVAPGGASSFARDFTRVGDSIFFVANDATHGNELWIAPLMRSDARQWSTETADR